MANVSKPELTIDVELVDGILKANVQVDYVIEFNTQDVASSQLYNEQCRLIGKDFLIADDAAAGAGFDDEIPNGLLTFLNFAQSTNGVTSVARSRTKQIDLSDLNEDQGAIPNPDEIRAVVTLSPIAVSAASRESNQVELNV